LGFEAESGLGEESAGEFGPVLDALEPVLAGHGTIAAYTLLRTCLARTQADSNNSPVTHLRGLCIREISVTVVQKVQA